MRPGQKPNEDAKRHERSLQALELRRKGHSYRTIADMLGVSVQTAFADVWRHFSELDKLATEELEQVRKLEIARLDKWLEALSDKCDMGDEKAIATGVKLMERRARLMGLDAPTKVEHNDVTAKRKELADMTADERIALHEQAIAEERAGLAQGKEVH